MNSMLRFPNPGSDIGAFVRMFRTLSKHLEGQASFTLDDMSKALVACNLATSSGHIGAEALRRSTRTDRTRDPLFNQSKMYSELYRILGWIHGAQDNRQKFNFTLLGAHISSGDLAPQELVEESLLRITYPNPYVEVKGEHCLRPIATIIRFAQKLDGRISRDEIILGPLRLNSDRNMSEVEDAIATIKRLRESDGVDAAVARFAKDVSIQLNTLRNYTRFPLGILRGAGFTTPMRQGRGVEDVLTPKGKAIANRILCSHDIRQADLAGFSSDQITAFVKLAFYSMMETTGFSLADIDCTVEDLKARCLPIIKKLEVKDARSILFSPFQECSPDLLLKAFIPYTATTEKPTVNPTLKSFKPGESTERKNILTTKVKLTQTGLPIEPASKNNQIAEIILSYKEGKDVESAINHLTNKYRHASKTTFYPAIADLFKCLGFDCSCSRTGVNYQRMDALILDAHESIPIEIKSPAEEEFLSVKGVRQALENKVVMLSRNYACIGVV